ncbi:cilia- and flagella-associated protein 95-like [Sycon ciliatum]|uniref:cilia- and flagella-associated protein 95-like n=1 Tax=Sycon ciliatum TaxID=27933 RepID=UPI0020AD0A9D
MSSSRPIPSFPERKGTLLLRSEHQDYTLQRTAVTGWHQAREAEPREYVVEDHIDNQDLHRSTYQRLGQDDVEKPESITKTSLQERQLLPDYTERQVGPPMVNEKNFSKINFDRTTKAPEQGFGSVLPQHKSGYNRHHLNTTYALNFQPPEGYDESQALTWEKVKEMETAHDYSKHRHRSSHFTDTDNYKQSGQWRD